MISGTVLYSSTVLYDCMISTVLYSITVHTVYSTVLYTVQYTVDESPESLKLLFCNYSLDWERAGLSRVSGTLSY